MMQSSDVTDLFNAAASGDTRADEAAYALVYEELKRCARRQRSFSPGSSLTPTALVSELYLKLRGARIQRVQDRRHFFGIAARAMRNILIDHARRSGSIKRGGEFDRLEINTQDLGTTTAQATLELDAALSKLSVRDLKLAQIVEWHFFCGLTFQQIADELDCHERTVRRDWELARAYLRQAMGEIESP